VKTTVKDKEYFYHILKILFLNEDIFKKVESINTKLCIMEINDY